MGGVVISPNPKKVKIQIDANGNEVKPFTKEVIRKKDEGYVPTAEELANLAAKPAQEPNKPGESALGGIIKQEVANAVVEAIKEMDIRSLIKDSIRDALK